MNSRVKSFESYVGFVSEMSNTVTVNTDASTSHINSVASLIQNVAGCAILKAAGMLIFLNRDT